MGKVASGVGKAVKNIAAGAISTISGGSVDINKMRVNVPFSSGAVRSLAGNTAKAFTGGLLDKKIDSVLGSKAAKLAGTAIGAAAGLGTGVGLASGALGAGSAAASAASSAGTAGGGLAPGALSAGLTTAAGASGGTGGSVLSTLGAVAPLAAAVPALTNAGKGAPSAPTIASGPTPDEIAKKLEQDRASAESQARNDRARKVAGSFRKKGAGEEDLTSALIENRSATRSVLGGF